MDLIQVDHYDEMSARASQFIINKIRATNKFVLGLATGSTPEGIYRILREKNKNGVFSFQNVTTFNLDEYVGLSEEDSNSYRYYMNDKLFNHVDISKDQTFIPNGNAADLKAECQRYDERIERVGGIDLQVLGLGMNGHIGFNEPGTSFHSKTQIVDLTTSTRKANARFFATMEDVPKQAITMGVATIMQSKEILLLVSGDQKADALERLFNGKVSNDFPASRLKEHPKVTVIADQKATHCVRV
ncbi:glucosamine-6-phosphate deaminase [Aquibacillus sp. 3ASR75-11]|uniref:Glucosamine-6-phosphate deaminase n=1 Tax=Terrihalobacillus insolitus TaxID=2950438 RepID=A0A9X3WQ07_9BACI|nr:glucosamine-6-phosphate deaminase [Terrihalobacillus insolitus]MDC3412216.1 glucosamine-6-phosphate deaminase [Terrihalobacillus insolitus]MDC3423090.1 glucosamine-6-phosphate deaminase [Terrihalobacillus insolitus]